MQATRLFVGAVRRVATTSWVAAARPQHSSMSGSRGIAALAPRMSFVIGGSPSSGLARNATPSLGCGLPGFRPAAAVGAMGGWGMQQVRGMRHGQRRGKLGMSPKKRNRMLRNLVTALVEHERIFTTVARAKELKRWGDWIVTMGKQRTITARRRAQAVLRTDESLLKVFSTLADRYMDRQGGYTRVLRHRKNRLGDNAPMAFVEYIDRPGELRDSRPPAQQLPYSKMLARAQDKGDADEVEYYTNLQAETVANRQRKQEGREKYLMLKSGKRESTWSKGMAEVGYVGPKVQTPVYDDAGQEAGGEGEEAQKQ